LDNSAPSGERPLRDSNVGPLAIRGGAIRVLGYVSGVLISLGSAAILVRHLGIATFGRYVTVTSLIALVGSFTEAGIGAYGIRESARLPDAARRRLLSELLGVRLTFTALGIGLATGFAWVAGYTNVLVVGTLIAGVGLLHQVATDVLSVPLQAELRLGRLAVVDFTRRLVALVLIACLAAIGAGLLPFVAVSIVAGAVALLLLTWLVRNSVAFRPRFDWHSWKASFVDSVPFGVAVSAAALYFYITIIVMSLIATERQTGIFATSFRIIQVALAIPGLVLTAVFPLLARDSGRSEPDLGGGLSKVFDVAIIFGVWLSLVTAMGASVIIAVVAGSKGHAAASVLRIQGIVLAVSFIWGSSMFALLALHRYRPMLIACLVAVPVNLVLNLVLVPALGARGGAVADVATETAVAIYLTMTLVRAVPRRRLSPKVIPRVALAAGASALVALLPGGAILRSIVATVVYFAILLTLRAIPDEVTNAVRRLPVPRTQT
jgi:O-antigen/teichoic acid export membrane protein